MSEILVLTCNTCHHERILELKFKNYVGKIIKCPTCRHPTAKVVLIHTDEANLSDSNKKNSEQNDTNSTISSLSSQHNSTSGYSIQNSSSTCDTLYGLRDVPVQDEKEELLGLHTYAQALTNFAERCATPMTIALQGDWGSGKTSLMNIIESNLRKKDTYILIWFNTWQYSQFGMEDQLAISMIKYFISKLPKIDEQKKFEHFVNNGFSVLRKVFGSAGKIAGHVIGGVTGDAIRSVAHAVDVNDTQENIEPEKFISELKDQLRNIITNIINDKHKKVIVFIDDLDRLEPIKAVSLLESFKLFLDIPGCVFFLACDYQVVVQGLKAKFGEENYKDEKNFFDKIIQLPFKMPVTSYKARNYISGLLDSIKIEHSEKDVEIYEKLIETSIGFNPRGLKRAFNSLLLNSEVAKLSQILKESDTSATISEQLRMIFSAICMQTAYEDFYIRMVRGKIKKSFFDVFENPSTYNEEYNHEKAPKKRKKSFFDVFNNSEVHDNTLDECSEFKKVVEDIKAKDSSFKEEKFKNFMQSVFDSMQLKSDYNGDEILSDEEYTTYLSIIQLSSITSTSSDEESEDEDDEDEIYDKTKRKEVREIMNMILTKFKHNKNITKFENRIKNSFSLQTHRNTSCMEIYIEDGRENPQFDSLYICYGFERKKDLFYIDFYPCESDTSTKNLEEVHSTFSDMKLEIVTTEDENQYIEYKHIFNKKDSIQIRFQVMYTTAIRFIETLDLIYN